MNDLNSFKKIFSWYRALSIALIKEMPEDMLNEQISDRSLPVRCQVIDLGLMQLITAEKMGASITKPEKPDDETASKEEIINYLNQTHEIVLNGLAELDPATVELDWFGRMHFSYEEALAFMLSHEAMHHGEILSFIFAKNLPMPQAFKDTWGFER
jgi:alpha-ketoglutarate-dependent taurine dioxygenase